ncbi:SDR family oxidoreductase [Catenuloplanes japonicus]|uniref:SDR family oxidoreductase n=1 Tax=Catenuloplanes japonicus TaxID=33876 RepID=UPI0007C5C6B2|nr:SDR family oxidoreductase [Catenuloplanes japonicus]
MARVAVITGSESGIGRAIAVVLAEAGFDIGITAHADLSKAEKTAEGVRAAGRRAEIGALDPTALPGAARVVDELADALGGLDVLVTCAGTGIGTPAADTADKDWRQVFTGGPFICVQRAVHRMIAGGRGGRIITITGVPSPRAHHTADGGLGLLTTVMAQELGAHDITVNSVAPGEDQDPHGIPLGRPGGAREVAAVVATLAGPAGSYVTGASWTVDGGRQLMGPHAGSHLNGDDRRS